VNVLITGCSTGIGFESALKFARSGNRVYATMRDLAKAGPLQSAAAAEGLDIRILQLDVDSQPSIDRAVREILVEGPVDVLVNNAGVTGVGAIEETSDAEFHAVMETNFFGPLRLIRAVLPGMRGRRAGTIINVSSVAGRLVAPIFGQYHASKWALECATETLAIEVKQFGIRVALVEPGFFITPILDKAAEALTDFENSPYVELDRRMRDLYAQATAAGGDPAVVAQLIEDVANTSSPKLRYLVGADAQPFVDGRKRLTDEQYQELGEEMTDEQWWAKFFEFFPMPVEA
jgi:NAD(P)-dependent dehydrogenase (short-subunit alcohol dehydrogenase family)